MADKVVRNRGDKLALAFRDELNLSVGNQPQGHPSSTEENIPLEHAVLTLEQAKFNTEKDRAVFYASGGHWLQGNGSPQSKSANQSLAEGFTEFQNLKLQFEAELQGGNFDRSSGFVLMDHTEEGRALHRLTDSGVSNIQLSFRGETFSTASYAEIEKLIVALAGAYSQGARGVITLAGDDAYPNTFFRRVEHGILMENRNVHSVQLIRAENIGADFIAPREFRPQSEGGRLVTMDKHAWNNWQRNHWIASSFHRVHRYLLSSEMAPPEEGKIFNEADLGFEYARAHFIGEIYHIAREIRRLQAEPHSVENQLARLQEGKRAVSCAKLILTYPELMQPLEKPWAADVLSSLIAPDADIPAAEVNQILGDYNHKRGESVRFANKQIQHLQNWLSGNHELQELQDLD
ncbi:MAG: hypothetical protein KDD70_08750 [Bdellovibrionales bacterium]|nr:hypothetical protein [Bdellovibrionales bacterium]